MKKRPAIISGALLTTGMALGAVFGPVGLAGAQQVEQGNEAAQPNDPSTDEKGPRDRGHGEGREGGHQRGRHARRAAIGEVLSELGIDKADVRAGRAGGNTLAEIASAAGVSSDELVAALVNSATARIDQAVENDRMDSETAAQIIAGLEDKISEKVNTVPGVHRDGEASNGGVSIIEGSGAEG